LPPRTPTRPRSSRPWPTPCAAMGRRSSSRARPRSAGCHP
jgi:hypothetical protein